MEGERKGEDRGGRTAVAVFADGVAGAATRTPFGAADGTVDVVGAGAGGARAAGGVVVCCGLVGGVVEGPYWRRREKKRGRIDWGKGRRKRRVRNLNALAATSLILDSFLPGHYHTSCSNPLVMTVHGYQSLAPRQPLSIFFQISPFIPQHHTPTWKSILQIATRRR